MKILTARILPVSPMVRLERSLVCLMHVRIVSEWNDGGRGVGRDLLLARCRLRRSRWTIEKKRIMRISGTRELTSQYTDGAHGPIWNLCHRPRGMQPVEQAVTPIPSTSAEGCRCLGAPEQRSKTIEMVAIDTPDQPLVCRRKTTLKCVA